MDISDWSSSMYMGIQVSKMWKAMFLNLYRAGCGHLKLYFIHIDGNGGHMSRLGAVSAQGVKEMSQKARGDSAEGRKVLACDSGHNGWLGHGSPRLCWAGEHVSVVVLCLMSVAAGSECDKDTHFLPPECHTDVHLLFSKETILFTVLNSLLL